MLDETTTSDVRKCSKCGAYLVLSRHDICDAPTEPVDTKKSAHCQDCTHTKPEEWNDLSDFYKKSGLIKCWCVVPFESVPKTGKRCFRWLSDSTRFDPDSEDPEDGGSTKADIRKLVRVESSKGNVNARKAKKQKRGPSEGMFTRAKELRLQSLRWEEITDQINKEFNLDPKFSTYTIMTRTVERFPEIKGMQTGQGNCKYDITDEMLERAKELRMMPLSLAEVAKRVNEEFSPDPQIPQETICGHLLQRFPKLRGIRIKSKSVGKEEVIKMEAKVVSEPEQPIESTGSESEPESSKEVEIEEVSSGPAEVVMPTIPSVMPETEPAIEDGTSIEYLDSRDELSPEVCKKIALKLEDFDWENIKKANVTGKVAVIHKADCRIRFGDNNSTKDCEYNCTIKSASAKSLNVEIPKLGELRLNWDGIYHIQLRMGEK